MRCVEMRNRSLPVNFYGSSSNYNDGRDSQNDAMDPIFLLPVQFLAPHVIIGEYQDSLGHQWQILK